MPSTSNTIRFALLALPLLLRASADRVADASSGKAPDAGDLVLFPLDDVSLPWRDNLKLTLERPAKDPGGPVLQAGEPEGIDGGGALLYGTVIKEEGKFRMWYLASPGVKKREPGDFSRIWHHRPVAYAESRDGIHWDRPNLGLMEFRGSRNNNLVRIEPASDPYSIPRDFIAVILDRADPDPRRRYKMAYITGDVPHGDAPSPATAVSPDGLSWRLVNTAMFTKGDFENTSLVRFQGLYYLSGQNHPPMDGSLADGSGVGRVMKVFFSPDFEHWSNGRALAFFRGDYQPETIDFGRELHMGAALWNRGNVILGVNGRWEGQTMVHRIAHANRNGLLNIEGFKVNFGLVVSNDAIHYREPVRNFIFLPNTVPSWPSEAILQGNAFANTDTETFIWYSDWDAILTDPAHPWSIERARSTLAKKYAIGLLRMPRDRFGAFSKLLRVSQERNPQYNVKKDASCLSCRLALDRPSRLSVNLDQVSPEASLQIALVDDAERPLPGYTADLGDAGLKAPVTWSGGSQTLPVGSPFRIKATWPVGVDRAKLYAFYIEHE